MNLNDNGDNLHNEDDDIHFLSSQPVVPSSSDAEASDEPIVVATRQVILEIDNDSNDDGLDPYGLLVIEDDDLDDEELQRAQVGEIVFAIDRAIDSDTWEGDALQLVQDMRRWLADFDNSNKKDGDAFVRRGLDEQFKKRERDVM